MNAPPPPLAGLALVLRRDVPLAPRTTLRIGGPARLLAEVSDEAALAGALTWAASEALPVLVLGKGSNLLVPDAGFPGLALVLAGELTRVGVDGTRVTAGGGASLMGLAVTAQRAGLSGLEGLSGIPSTVGGAVRINAGAYGSELFDVLTDLTLVSREGAVRAVTAAEVPHGYRWSALVDSREIVARARLELREAPPGEIAARMTEVRERRRRALPEEPNAGSIFKNPPADHAGRLLESCGLKGLRRGGAEVSARHANVIVNVGGASSADVLWLMGRMRESVLSRFEVALEPEIELLEPPPWVREPGAEPQEPGARMPVPCRGASPTPKRARPSGNA